MEGYTGFAFDLLDDDPRKARLIEQFQETCMDDSETWSLDASIIKYLHSRLVRFYEIADEKIDLDFHEGLREDIEKMIECFSHGLGQDYFDLSDKTCQEKIQEGFDILAYRHRWLWW